MTNPNCEYSLNTPAFVTLAEWINNPDWDPSGENENTQDARFLWVQQKPSLHTKRKIIW
jgi:hypothetical protein